MMNEQRVTPMTYLGEIAATSWRHGGELAEDRVQIERHLLETCQWREEALSHVETPA
jgi:hypothetical protein